MTPNYETARQRAKARPGQVSRTWASGSIEWTAQGNRPPPEPPIGGRADWRSIQEGERRINGVNEVAARQPRLEPHRTLPDFFATALCKLLCAKRENERVRDFSGSFRWSKTSPRVSLFRRARPPENRPRNPLPPRHNQTPRSNPDRGIRQLLCKSLRCLKLLAPRVQLSA